MILISFLFITAHANATVYNEKTHQFKCANVQKVTKEAVAYAILGAWEPFANRNCFASERYEFFNPRAAKPEGEVVHPERLIRFKKGRDKYSIDKVVKAGDEYNIESTFVIDGKKIQTTFIYTPDAPYTGRTGICGFVNNDKHTIMRSDCVDEKLLTSLANVIKNRR